MRRISPRLICGAILALVQSTLCAQQVFDASTFDAFNAEAPTALEPVGSDLRAIYARLEALESSRRSAPGVPSSGSQPPAAGGGSKASGGDPTVYERPQEGPHYHPKTTALHGDYDYEHGGFHWTTEDREFEFSISTFSQLDAKTYPAQSPGFATSGFYNPRTRFYLQGHATKPIQYSFSFQNTYNSVGLTDAYLNFNYDSRFQIRIGRFKTPFTYEFYRIHVWDLLSPECFLFANNFEGNRRLGLMLWGVMADNRFEYAVGTFNTQRNSYQPNDNNQDVMAFLNFKPFYNADECCFFRDLQFGGSVDAGHENQAVLPAVLRTNLPPSSTELGGGGGDQASVPFLAFNPGVIEHGSRALWELHLAHYYRGMTFLTAWQGGRESYGLGAAGTPTKVPIHGWLVQSGYILTGESIRDRTLIAPNRPFGRHAGSFGLGAWELTARYSELEVGSEVFSAGLADPTLWSNRAELVDVGVNWYLNKAVKIYFVWEHARFADPVLSRSGTPQTSNDQFWLRTQIYL